MSEPDVPFRLVYVDGRSPGKIRRHLEAEAKRKGFQLISSSRYLSPTEARILGLSRATGKYVVFIDNDVLVSAGWLGALVRCAEETVAWLVGPLYCFGDPPFAKVHMAGGTAHVEVREGKRCGPFEGRSGKPSAGGAASGLSKTPCSPSKTL